MPGGDEATPLLKEDAYICLSNSALEYQIRKTVIRRSEEDHFQIW